MPLTASLYRPRRGRIKEGVALAVYLAMNIASESGNALSSEISTSVLAPLSGELPKAEGAPLAVYFSMNTASALGDVRS